MGDDDMIRRGDALKIALAYASGEGGALAEHAIRAIPAADARADALKEAAAMIRHKYRMSAMGDEAAAAILALITEKQP